jgi:uncharacterized protein YbjT (DUF2867 family)
MTILVTGATGRPGSAVIREFARHSHPVRALVRTPEKARALEGLPSVEVTGGDMLDPETLGVALDGVDRVLMISSAGPQMLETQCTFIDAARRAGVKHVVKFSGEDSTIGFDPERFRSTRSHEQIERYLKGSGLLWTMLRPSQFMQVYHEEAPTIAAAGELRLPLGDARLAPVDIEDIARVAHTILRTDGHQGRTYRMTGPEALSMAEIAERISRAIGRSVQYVNVAPEEKRREWLASGYPPERADAFLQLFEERHRRRESRVDMSTHEAFGVSPTTFADFAQRTATMFRGESAYAATPA